jgi:hypothetical protein
MTPNNYRFSRKNDAIIAIIVISRKLNFSDNRDYRKAIITISRFSPMSLYWSSVHSMALYPLYGPLSPLLCWKSTTELCEANECKYVDINVSMYIYSVHIYRCIQILYICMCIRYLCMYIYAQTYTDIYVNLYIYVYTVYIEIYKYL